MAWPARCAATLALLLLAAAIALPAAAAGPTLGPLQTIGGLNAVSAFPQVDIDGQRAVAAFDIFDSSPLKAGIYRRYSTDGGDTWGPIEAVYTAGDQQHLSDVTVDGMDAYIVYSLKLGNDIHYYFSWSSDGGVTFDPALDLGIGPPWASFLPVLGGARVAVFGKFVWVTFVDKNLDLVVRRSVNTGLSFEAPVMLEMNPDVKTQFARIANDGKNVYVLSEVDNFGFSLLFHRSTDGGQTFSPPVELAPARKDAYWPVEVAAFGFRTAAAWVRSGGSEVVVKASFDRGVAFSKPIHLRAVSRATFGIAATKSRINVLWHNRPAAQGVTGGATSDLVLASLLNRSTKFTPATRVAANVSLLSFDQPAIAAAPNRAIYLWTTAKNGRSPRVRGRVGTY